MMFLKFILLLALIHLSKTSADFFPHVRLLALAIASIPIIRLDRPKRLGLVPDRIGRQSDLQSKLDFVLELVVQQTDV